MTIHEVRHKIKGIFSGDAAVVAIIILVGLSAFGLGRLSVLGEVKEPVRIEQMATAAGAFADTAAAVGGKLVASKNGSVYHFPWCPGAQRIAEGNKIWFDSAEEAERAGYRPAENCKGLNQSL